MSLPDDLIDSVVGVIDILRPAGDGVLTGWTGLALLLGWAGTRGEECEEELRECGADTVTLWSCRGYSSLDSPTSSEVSLDTVRLGTSGARLTLLELRWLWWEGRAWPEPQLAQWA